MLPENVNWNAVLQSITDTWLPLIGMVAGIILVAIIVHFLQFIGKDRIRIIPLCLTLFILITS